MAVTADDIPGFDLYAELEVSERASPETIQAAYRSLQLRHHPDRVGPDGAARAVRLNVARDWLTDPERRARYDARLAGARRPAWAAPEVAEDEDGDGDEDVEVEAGDAPSLLQLARRHLRIDPGRLIRIWIVGLAALGALAIAPVPDGAVAARVAVASLAVALLVGLTTRRRRARADDGFVARGVRTLWTILGWAGLAALALEGGTVVLGALRHEPLPGALGPVVLPAVAAIAVVSAFAIRRRTGPVGATVDDFLAMTPREFEVAVGDILGRRGYRLEITGGPGDLAADLTGTDPEGRPTVVQCKRYAPGHPVGSRDVQLLIAMGMRHHGAEHLVLVTTSAFTDPARDLADEHGVTLIDGPDLEDLTR